MIVVVLFLLLRLFSSFSLQSRLWGLNQAGYTNGMVFLYIALLLGAVFIYLKGGKKPVFFKHDQSKTFNPFKTIFPYLIIIIASGLFYLFSVSAHFLGDGYQILSKLSVTNLALKAESYGEMIIHRSVAGLFGELNELNVYYSFKYISIVAGTIFVSSLLYYSRKLYDNTATYYSFISIVMLSAITILFYGYVETYSIVTAILFLFLISLIASVKNQNKSAIPILAFIFLVFLHKLMLVYLPVLIVYLVWMAGNKSIETTVKKHFKKIIFLFLGVPFLIYAGALIFGTLKQHLIFLSPFGNRFTVDNYYLFSFNHIIDFINNILFVIPLCIPALLLLKRKTDSSTYVKLVLLSCSIPPLIIAFVIDPKLGMARDWDLFSTLLFGAFFSSTYYWFSIAKNNKQFQTSVILLIILSFSVIAPWLALNNSANRLYNYTVNVLKLDPKHGRTGLFSIARLAEGHGFTSAANSLKKYCNSNYPEKWLFRDGESYLKDKKDARKAESCFRRAINENPSFFSPYQSLARVMMETKRLDEALEYLEIADALNPSNSDNSYYTGVIYLLEKDTERGAKYFNRSIMYDSLNPLPYFALSDIYYKSGNIDSSKLYYNSLPDTVDIFPVEFNYQLGLMGLKLRDSSRAMLFFDKYIAVGNDSSLITNILEIKKSSR